MRHFVIIFLLLLIHIHGVAQEGSAKKNAYEKEKKEQKAPVEKKTMSASKLADKPKIDGNGDDEVWKDIPLAFSGNFTQISPKNLETSAYTTQIKVGYTDYALYVIGYMNDPAPATVAKELGLRDDFGRLADRFGIVLDTYNQGQNAFYFAVTSAGVQLDLYITPNNEDTSWDAVWDSAVQITDQGWVAELEIPWSAIRFAKRPEQLWGVNFMRVVRSQNEESFWSPVDATVSGIVNQSGTLTGINNIQPPLRLQLFPYVSSVSGYDRASGSTSTVLGGGMDVKWGISESFTLDMALIPDFSQVQSDNQVLNLSPYEVQFDENRPFFTEGTELFNKKNLFYSRRVGHVFNTFTPELPETSTIISSPSNTKLINATKISGRTHKGFGVGFFNALTNDAFIEVQDTLRAEGESAYTLQKRKVMIDPLTNFNIAVIDQNLPNNSNIAFINTNVTRWNGGRDANVAGTEFRFRNKKNTYEIQGFGAGSYVWSNENPENGEQDLKKGYRYNLSVGKISGNFLFRLSRNVESDKYDINDMGINRAPNEVEHNLWMGYQVLSPFWIFNQMGLNFNTNYERLYEPATFTRFNFNSNGWVQFKNFWEFAMGFSKKPIDSYDYFEPRTQGYYFTRLPDNHGFLYLGTDRRKRLALNTEIWRFSRKAWDAEDWGIWLAPRYRISNKVSVNTGLNYTITTNERGFVNKLFDNNELRSIIFGNRDIQTIEPSARVNVTFNNKMGLNMRMRYYWSRVRYTGDFYELQRDGSLLSTEYRADKDGNGLIDANANFNSFNVDLFYSWQIAPGSFLTFAWKDAAFDYSDDARPDFSENIRRFRQQPHTHTFSLKLTYYLDYLMVKNWMQ